MSRVAAADWRAAVEAAMAEGYTFFDWLGAVDEIGRTDEIRVVVVLRSLTADASTRQLETMLPRQEPQLASIRDLLAGAAWPEREAAELFGVDFVAGDHHHLLLGEAFTGTPLRKDDVLAARTGVAWPGGKEPGEGGDGSPSRRRMVPPGVPDAAVWGDRPLEAPAAGPDEIAVSTVGGRVRRTR